MAATCSYLVFDSFLLFFMISTAVSINVTCPSSPSPNATYPVRVSTSGGNYFFAARMNDENSDFIDIHLEGTAEGWVAVGFTTSKTMSDSDVLACKRDSTSDIVYVIDTWNPSTRYSANIIDNNQIGMCEHVTEYNNGRITCTFSRYIGVVNVGQDLNLNQSLWHIYNALSARGGSGTSGLHKHSITPDFSYQQMNLVTDTVISTAVSINMTCPSGPSPNATYPVRVSTSGGNYFFAARMNDENSDFIDIHLEGTADGWVAVGFTTSKTMSDSDVLACKRDSTSDIVYAIDTWNPSAKYSANIIDNTQIGMCQHVTGYNNGRITCTFSRYIGVVNVGQDLNLNQSLWHIYNALSARGGSGTSGLHKHSITPDFSYQQRNLVTDIITGSVRIISPWPKDILLKLHGIFMLTAWVLLATSGVFFAAWMKPTLPNGEWFQSHRALMIGSLFVGAAGFIFAFVAHAKNTTIPGIIDFNPDGVNTAHFAIGFIVMFLHIANPIVSIFRCEPSKTRRWIFNLTHAHIIGYGALLFALINIGIGISLLSESLLPIYIAFLILLMTFQVVLFVIYTINAYKAPKDDRHSLVHSLLNYKYIFRKESQPSFEKLVDESSDNDIELSETDESGPLEDNNRSQESPVKTKPLKSALVRFSWITLAIQLIVVLVTVIAFSVVIGIGSGDDDDDDQ